MDNILIVGKTYKMSGFDAVCIKQRSNGLYKMQTLGMTAGHFPGTGDISDYDDITEAFAKKWENVISDFRLPSEHNDKMYPALMKAAENHSLFGANDCYAWLNNDDSTLAYFISLDGKVGCNVSERYSYVVAPCFNLDPSKIILDGDEIKSCSNI